MKIHDLEMYHNLASNNNSDKKYCLIYTRKSEESEDRQVQSIDDQLRIAQQLVMRKNLILLDVPPFTESRSAKMPGRPQFNEMINLIKSRRDIKAIIVWKLNRLSRNPEDEGKIRQLLSDGTIEEIITPEKTYTQVDSDFIMAIEGAQAQRFITDLRRDSNRGVQSKIQKGIAPILAPPGYRNAVEKKQGERDIQPHPIYFPLMRQVFDYALTGNHSAEGVYKKLVELKVKNSRNQIVSKTQFYKIIRDPFYTGTRYCYGGKLYLNGIHKPMITDTEFDLLQEIFTKKTRLRTPDKAFLNGLFTCGECGMQITHQLRTKKYKNGTSQAFGYYRCTKKKNGVICSQPYLPDKELENQAIKYLGTIWLSPRFVEWGIKWLNVMHQNQTEIKNAKLAALQQEYNETDKKIDKLVDLMISGIVDETTGAAKKQKLEDEKARLFSSLSKLDTHATEWTNLSIQTFNFIKTAQEKFNNGTVDERKTIMRLIGSNLVIKDRNIIIQLRKPFEYIQKVAEEIKGKKSTLEPVELPVISTHEAFSGASISVMGG